MFPRGEDGYRLNICHRGVQLDVHGLTVEHIPTTIKKRVRLMMREWFSYRIMDENDEVNTILRLGKFFHKFLVDGWTMIESRRLLFI